MSDGSCGCGDHNTYILSEDHSSQQICNVLHMDQVCYVRFLGCEQTRYNKKFGVQGWEDGELGVKIATFITVFENLGPGRVFYY